MVEDGVRGWKLLGFPYVVAGGRESSLRARAGRTKRASGPDPEEWSSLLRKLTLAFAVLASLGGASLATSASALPGAPIGVTAPETISTVQMTRMERRMMRNRMERRMERRHMHRKMMHRRMMRRM